jgi:AcrR family transcriptional regulator
MSAVRESTRARLARSGREVIEDGGYAAASVIAIARAAGVATGTMYGHFPSKGELFVEVFRAAGDEVLAQMEEAASQPGAFAERLDAVVATYVGHALRRPRLVWALVYEPVDPVVDAERLSYRRRYCQRLATALKQAIAAREIPSQNAELTAAALVGGIAEALVGPLSPAAAKTMSEQEIVASLQRFCRQAVGAR